MRVVGIIAEYDPFHNGHQYHLEQAKALARADYVIVILSGNYTQRGTPAAFDKYVRTEMALQNGADLVLELPLYYATGSAEYFAAGAVALLDRLGVVDALCFGSECGDAGLLTKLAELLTEEPPLFSKTLRTALKEGKSFPKAREEALAACLETPSAIAGALSSPNNILGLEYCKALLKRKSGIRPLSVQRQGSDHHDSSLPQAGGLSSASAIRTALFENHNSSSLTRIRACVPDSVHALLAGESGPVFPVRSNDFSGLLRYRLLMEEAQGYEKYVDVTPFLSNRIRNRLNGFTDYDGFCALLKTKEVTVSRVRRALLHILLTMEKSRLLSYVEKDYVFYARILGLRKKSGGLLHAIRKNASVPLLAKLADARALLEEAGSDRFLGSSMLQKELAASHLYASMVRDLSGQPFVNEYARPLILK